MTRGDYDRAEEAFRHAPALTPDESYPYYALGLLAVGVLFGRAAGLDTRNAEARACLGLLAQRSGDTRSAENFYRQAIALDPGHSLARNNLGALYMQRQQWPAALDQFVALLDRRPDDYEAAFNRAAALDALGRRAEARNALEALLPRLPADPRFDGYRQGAALILEDRTRP